MPHEFKPPQTSTPHAVILLATYNGASQLQEQLKSFAEQDFSAWSVLVRDDNSTDNTVALLKAFAAKGHTVVQYEGDRKGAAQNFLALLRIASERIDDASYVALSDQDDVWFPDKLSRGITALKGIPGPAIYCSRTLISEGDTAQSRLSASRPRTPSFRNALVQNITAGNTILLNPEAAKIACEAAHEVGEVVMHDWWLYQLMTGVGARIVHDDTPTLLYRQHAQNVVGANDGICAQMRRLGMLIRGEYKTWNHINVTALNRSKHRFTAQVQRDLQAFEDMRKARLIPRLIKLRALSLYRQTKLSTMALWFAALSNRI